jgi:hypothetical protein
LESAVPLQLSKITPLQIVGFTSPESLARVAEEGGFFGNAYLLTDA